MRKPTVKLIGLAALVAVIAGAGAATAGPSRNRLQGEGEGLKLVANIKYEGGSDMEFISHKGREYGIVGALSPPSSFRVIDITNPEKPKVAAQLPCVVSQGDIQISHDRKTAMLALDSAAGPDSCAPVGKEGFLTINISNPRKPKVIGFAETGSSHNTTAHPTKPFVYNSNSKLAPPGVIQIWSIANPAKPKLVNTVPSLPHSPHDLSFNEKGSMIVTASISHFDLWNTSDPKNPELVFTGQCPGCSITHDAKFTPDGKNIVIGDEGGGGAPYPCPGGALYFYRLQGSESQPLPVLTGIYEPDEFVATANGPGGCTAHVFDISDDGSKIAISWYTAGTRYLDIGDLSGAAIGPHSAGNITELGWFLPEGGDTWSSKFHKGPYIYSNDLTRGFDVFKITAKGKP